MNTSDSNFCVFPRYTHIRSRMRDWWTDFASPNGKVYLRQTVNHYNPKYTINATQAGIFFSQVEFFVFFKLKMTTNLHSAMSRCSVAETQVLPQSVQTGSSTSGTVRKLQKQGPRSLIPEKIGVLSDYLIPWRTCLVLISAYFERFSRLITKTQLYSVACTLWRCVSVLLLGDVKSVRGVPLTTCDELTVDTFHNSTLAAWRGWGFRGNNDRTVGSPRAWFWQNVKRHLFDKDVKGLVRTAIGDNNNQQILYVINWKLIKKFISK